MTQKRAEQIRQGQAREVQRQMRQRQQVAMRQQRQQQAHWRQAAVQIQQGANQLQQNRAGSSPRSRGRGAIGSSRSGVDWSQVAARNQEGVQLEKYRAEFVQQLLKQATSLAKGYNVMVLKLGPKHEIDVQDQKLYQEVNYNGHRYGIWIFKKGKFTNKGDGGWMNWGMSGNFTRDGKDRKTVNFY